MQLIVNASRGQICMSSNVELPVKNPWHPGEFTCTCRHLEFGVYSVRGDCRADAGKFPCFYS